jgi:transcriptional regulator
MYTPPAFRLEDLAEIHAAMAQSRLATLVTPTAQGLQATPLPLFLDPAEGPHGTLYGHLARANPHWSLPATGDSLVLFQGPHAYVSPSWYPSKAEHHKVVPTWNYQAIHAHGPAEFFQEPERLLAIVTRLTALHEADMPAPRAAAPWAVSDAPPDFVASQLRGIVGLRIPLSRIEAKRKMSQNRPAPDRAAVAAALAASPRPSDRAAAALIPD